MTSKTQTWRSNIQLQVIVEHCLKQRPQPSSQSLFFLWFIFIIVTDICLISHYISDLQMFCFRSIKYFIDSPCFCRLPDNDRRLVLWVCVRGGRRQEVPPSWCPGSDGTGAHCTSCLGPNGIPSITTEIQVLAPTPGLFDSALFLSCFYLFNISPTLPIKSTCSSRQNNKDFVFFFTGLPVPFVCLYFYLTVEVYTVAPFALYVWFYKKVN